MKKIIFIISLSIIPLITIAQNEKGELRGVVTYFFNDNYGSKPDVGAKVIIQKINYPTERTPKEIEYDSDLVRLIQDTVQLIEKIKKEEKDLADIDTTQKKSAPPKNNPIQATKNKPIQATKGKSFIGALDIEQKKHEVILDTFGKFDMNKESYNLAIEFYNKEQEEAKRHYQAIINIIDTFGRASGESENKLKQRKLLADREQNTANIKIDEDRYKYISIFLGYEKDMKKTNFHIEKMKENSEVSSTIRNLKTAEWRREYVRQAPTKKFKEEQIDALKSLNAYPEEKFNELDKQVYSMISDIEYGKDRILYDGFAKTTTVDGNGNYSIKLDPGIYYIIIRSNGRKNHSLTESSGQISGIDIIEIKSNETIEKSEDFKGGF